jgi:hypothetical protein
MIDTGLTEMEMKCEFRDFWAKFCIRENLGQVLFLNGVIEAERDIDYYFQNDLWLLVDKIRRV